MIQRLGVKPSVRPTHTQRVSSEWSYTNHEAAREPTIQNDTTATPNTAIVSAAGVVATLRSVITATATDSTPPR